MTRKPRISREENGRQTRQALLKAALRVVSRHGFAGASVQRITAACGVALGSLYTYFESHRQLLEELLPHEGILMLQALGRSVDRDADHFENERRTIEALFLYLRRKPYFLRLLTEAEIAAPASHLQHMLNIEERYVRTLRRARDAGQVRPAGDDDYRVAACVLSCSRGYIGIGMCQRSAGRLFHPPPIEPWIARAYVRFVRHGIGSGARPPARLRRAAQRDVPAVAGRGAAPAEAGGTREAILDAAARCIHRSGYAGSSVASICAEAGVAVGTFYGHFPSRTQMFDALIERVRGRMLAEVARATEGSTGFLEHESRSFDAFFEHLARNPWFVRIETEAAVWAPESYLRHFQEIASSHLDAMHRHRGHGELALYEERELPVLAWILMAARHHLATRFVLREGRVTPLPAPVRRAYLELVGRGLEAASGAAAAPRSPEATV